MQDKTSNLDLSFNAYKILKNRYLLRDDMRNVIETPENMFRRVAKSIAKVEFIFDKASDVKKVEEKFYRSMINFDFLPNSPTLMNAGTNMEQLSACFALPVADSIKSIFEAVKNMAIIHKTGGGTGFFFGRLRPQDDIVKSTKGVASGPVSFMRVFDMATGIIKQGGKRRGANMAVLNVEHPDIVEFIKAKAKKDAFSNFNLSISVTDKFMEAVIKNRKYSLINPRNGKISKEIPAKKIFNLIVNFAWQTGDPGLIFIDEVNRHNPTPYLGKIETTNPCGELPLLSWESCNLGSINLSKMVDNKRIKWKKLKDTVKTAVRFLDNVVSVTKFPHPKIKEISRGNRKIGLGVMGFADALVLLGIPYNSEKAVKIARKIMHFISQEAKKASVELANQRGVFPNFKRSIYDFSSGIKLRNATLTTIAPTGSISIIANCSSGIEPLFAVVFVRNVMGGSKILEINPIFKKIAKKRKFYSMELIKKVAQKGSIKDLKEIPSDIRRLFVTAFDISPEWHVRIQSAFQKYTDNSVSKTINLPSEITEDEVKNAFLLAYKYKCKGITIYRYGSKKEQVLSIADVFSKEKATKGKFIIAESEYSGGCPKPYCLF